MMYIAINVAIVAASPTTTPAIITVDDKPGALWRGKTQLTVMVKLMYCWLCNTIYIPFVVLSDGHVKLPLDNSPIIACAPTVPSDSMS